MTPKDLYVLTTDADAQEVMTSILRRPQSLGIRELSFDVGKAMHDSTVVIYGPDLLPRHNQYDKVMLLWDYHGSGKETKKGTVSPHDSANEVLGKLEDKTWKGRSAAIVIVPELEEWLWHNPESIRWHLGVSSANFNREVRSYAAVRSKSVEFLRREEPKALLQHLFQWKFHRSTIRPSDFGRIAAKASLKALQASASFRLLAETLVTWFPRRDFKQ